jgi:hypothetical protein
MQDPNEYPVKGQGFTVEHAAAVVVIGSLLFLILVRRGFRGISAGGVSVGIR